MQAYAVGSRKQFFERQITRLVLSFDVRRQASPLRVNDSHSQRDRAQRQFPTDLAQSHDTQLALVKRNHSRDACPVAVRRVRPIIGGWTVAGILQLLEADEVCVPSQLARQSKHQRQGLLRGGNIRAPADRQQLNPRSFTGELINIASGEAVFLHEPKCVARCRYFSRADHEFLDHEDAGCGSVRQQLGLIAYEMNLSRVNVLRLRADAVAPTSEVRRIVFTEMGKRLNTFFGSAWIEDNLNEAKEAIVLDDEFERHKKLRSKVQPFNGSKAPGD